MDTGIKPEQHLPTWFCKGGNQEKEMLESNEAERQKKRSCSTWQLVWRAPPFISRAQRSACIGGIMYLRVCVPVRVHLCVCVSMFVCVHICVHACLCTCISGTRRSCKRCGHAIGLAWKTIAPAAEDGVRITERVADWAEGKVVCLRERCLDQRRGWDGEDGWLGEACQVTVIYWTWRERRAAGTRKRDQEEPWGVNLNDTGKRTGWARSLSHCEGHPPPHA